MNFNKIQIGIIKVQSILLFIYYYIIIILFTEKKVDMIIIC